MIKNKKLITITCLVVLPIVVSFILVNETGVPDFFDSIRNINVSWIALACVCMALYWVFDCSVLNIFCKMLDPNQKFRTIMQNTMLGQFFNAVTPFASGGQPMQLYHLVESAKMSVGSASSALLLKFIVFQTVLTLYSGTVLIFKFQFFAREVSNFAALSLIGFLVNFAVIAVCFLFWYNKALGMKLVDKIIKIGSFFKIIKDVKHFRDKLSNEVDLFYNCHMQFKGNMGLWIKTGIITIIELTLYYSIPYCILRSFSLNGDIINLISAQSFVQMLISFIPLPGASGAAEGSFYIIFKMFFLQGHIALGVFLWRLITYYSCIIFGGIVMLIPILQVRRVKLKA